MKAFEIRHNFLYLLTFFFIAFLLSSCDTYNFTEAQPVDKENIYVFPDEFLGKWFVDSSNDSYLVNSTNVLFIQKADEASIVKGAWPQVNAKGDYIYPPTDKHPFRSINFDSLKNPLDTVDNYLLKGDKIYEITEEGYLQKGRSYRKDNDTLTVFDNDTLLIDLGQNAFLRRLNKDLYVLNIRNDLLGYCAYNGWWRIIMLEVKQNQSITMWELNSYSRNLPCMVHYNPGKGDDLYFDCKWTTADILHLLETKYFEVSSELHREKRHSQIVK